MMTFRLVTARYRIKELLDIMGRDKISSPEKIAQLGRELSEFHGGKPNLLKCHSMGQLVKEHLKVCLRKNLLLVPRLQGRFSD